MADGGRESGGRKEGGRARSEVGKEDRLEKEERAPTEKRRAEAESCRRRNSTQRSRYTFRVRPKSLIQGCVNFFPAHGQRKQGGAFTQPRNRTFLPNPVQRMVASLLSTHLIRLDFLAPLGLMASFSMDRSSRNRNTPPKCVISHLQ